jgi:hypothetical protein
MENQQIRRPFAFFMTQESSQGAEDLTAPKTYKQCHRVVTTGSVFSKYSRSQDQAFRYTSDGMTCGPLRIKKRNPIMNIDLSYRRRCRLWRKYDQSHLAESIL